MHCFTGSALHQSVSIRVRPRERTIRRTSNGWNQFSRFNPRPPSRADDARCSNCSVVYDAFQSASALASGRFECLLVTMEFAYGFNPRPPSRADDSADSRERIALLRVSIRVRPRERTIKIRSRNDFHVAVSIRVRPRERTMLRIRSADRRHCVSIRVRPRERTIGVASNSHVEDFLFQSASALASGRSSKSYRICDDTTAFQSASALASGR